jgi:uncharacterized DUF497 family protein
MASTRFDRNGDKDAENQQKHGVSFPLARTPSLTRSA